MKCHLRNGHIYCCSVKYSHFYIQENYSTQISLEFTQIYQPKQQKDAWLDSDCNVCFLTIDNGPFWQQNCAEMYNVSVPLVSDDLNTDISIIWVRLPALTAAAVTTLADGSSAPRAKTSHNHCSVCLTTHTHTHTQLSVPGINFPLLTHLFKSTHTLYKN